VLVHRVDRLIRNHYEYGLLVEHLGVRVVSVVEPAEDSAAGRLLHGMNVVVAKYHSDNLSQEVRKGLRAKFEAGGWPSKAPVGYRNISRTHTEKARIVIDPEMAAVVRHLFEQYATGRYSLAGAAALMFDHGLRTASGRPYSPERIRKLLRDRAYLGETRHRGEYRPGTHEPVIARPLFDAVQCVLARRGKDSGEKGSRFFLLRGLLWCRTCGRRLTGEDHPKGSYYRCLHDPQAGPCAERYVPVRMLDRAVEELLPRIVLREDARHEVLAALRRMEAERSTLRERDEHGLRKRREKLVGKLTRLTDGYAGGVVPLDQYRQLRAAYERDIAVVDERLTLLTEDISVDVAALEAVLDEATAVDRLYRLASTPAERKDHLRRMFKRIEVANRTIVGIEYQTPFDLLLGDAPAQAGSRESMERRLLEAIASQRRTPLLRAAA
jgi:hypothetical protein